MHQLKFKKKDQLPQIFKLPALSFLSPFYSCLMAYLTNAYPFELVPWRWVAEVVLYVLILRDGPSADLFSHAGRILVEGNAYLFAGLTRYP
jgi:hypothetical protein